MGKAIKGNIFEDTGRVEAAQAVGAVKRLIEKKADSYEVFFSSDSGLSAEAQNGAVEALKVRRSLGVGIRAITKGRLGFAFSSVLTEDALREIVDKTIRGSSEASEDEFLMLPGEGDGGAARLAATRAALAGALDIADGTIGSFGEDELIGSALLLESSAMSASPKIARVRKASYGGSVRHSMLINSNGLDESFSATYFSASVTAVAEEDGASEMGWDIGMAHRRAAIDVEAVGKSAAKNALRMLGGKRIPTVRCPAVIENTVVCELLESLSGSFLADNVQKGKSMLAGKTGLKIASPAISIYDDGLLKGGWASSPFDGEGVGRRKTELVAGGVLKGYLYDTYWAARARGAGGVGAASTGNASRGGFKGLPSVGVSNIYIEKGTKTLEGLLAALGRGLFITEVLGAHTINTVSGDFSVGAAGLWVEGGRGMYPVKGMAVSGNLLELFSKVTEVSSDMRFIGSIGAPSVLVSELEASGS